jgi:hypothetical protein
MVVHRSRLVVAAACLAALAVIPALAQPLTIVPGKAIGPIEIGMPLDRARTLMESFGRVEEVNNPAFHGFCNPEDGVGVCAFDRVARLALNTPGVVGYVVTDDARFTTEAGGLKIGALLLDFLRTFGLYSGGRGSEIRWESRGLAVDVIPDDRGIVVQFIAVFAPRGVSAMVVPAL